MSLTPDLNADDPILRIGDVEHQIGLKRSSIYSLVQKGEFPSPIRLGARASGWLLSEVNTWKRQRIAASRPAKSSGADGGE